MSAKDVSASLKCAVAAVLFFVFSAAAEPEVVKIKLERPLEAYGNEQAVFSVSATSPGGCDLKDLKWCVCGTNREQVVCTWRNPVGPRTEQLSLNLPAGDYALRTTDGTWFYGEVPFTVKMREGASAPGVNRARPVGGLRRFWRDLTGGAFFRDEHAQNAPARKE